MVRCKGQGHSDMGVGRSLPWSDVRDGISMVRYKCWVGLFNVGGRLGLPWSDVSVEEYEDLHGG